MVMLQAFKSRRYSLFSMTLLAGVLMLSACGGPSYQVRVIETPDQPQLRGTQRPYEVNGERYQPLLTSAGFVEEGIASWYGKDFHGRKTSNGEIYDMYAMTAAHKILPMNVHLKVTNLRNGKSTIVRINDRGPFIKGRIIDLSYTAARELEVVGPGTAPVKIEALGYKEQDGSTETVRYRHPLSYEMGPFMVQVGAFTLPDNAHRLAEKLNAEYGSSAVVEAWVSGRKFYRVRVGLYRSLADADEARKTFEFNGYPNSFVVAKE